MSERHLSPVEEIAKLKGRLTEAIAQRDAAANVNGYYANEAFRAREQLAAAEHLVDICRRVHVDALDIDALERQLAAERVLCDRARSFMPFGGSWQADYDALRATERAPVEESDTTTVRWVRRRWAGWPGLNKA